MGAFFSKLSGKAGNSESAKGVLCPLPAAVCWSLALAVTDAFPAEGRTGPVPRPSPALLRWPGPGGDSAALTMEGLCQEPRCQGQGVCQARPFAQWPGQASVLSLLGSCPWGELSHTPCSPSPGGLLSPWPSLSSGQHHPSLGLQDTLAASPCPPRDTFAK